MTSDDLTRLDATALLSALQAGGVTAVAATRAYLDRIGVLNPHLHAVITVNPDALRDAEALDLRPVGERGPLHGLPVLIKDNIDVTGLPTTAGSWLMRDHVPSGDAPLVSRLRAAGAVMLGKANMTEWANFMTVGMPNGYSSLGGQTVNPWRSGLDTGGSSSGSGVAVAARLCAAAIGTETSGSIVSPAHQNGVVGLKPTLGLVPRTGVVPISHSQDTAGPLTRSARDAALLLRVIAGPDAADPATRGVTLDTAAGGPSRVVLITDSSHVAPRNADALQTVGEAFAAMGASVTREAFPSRAELDRSGWMLDVLLYEFKGDLNAYLAGVQRGPRSLAEVIRANDTDPARCLKYGQTLLHAAEGTRGDFAERAYHAARERDLRLSRTEGFDVLFGAGAELVVFPGIHGYDLAAKAGYPSVALPTPHGGEPAGVLLVAAPGRDLALLEAAARLTQAWGDLAGPTVTA